jgi:hypothetical protein
MRGDLKMHILDSFKIRTRCLARHINITPLNFACVSLKGIVFYVVLGQIFFLFLITLPFPGLGQPRL